MYGPVSDHAMFTGGNPANGLNPPPRCEPARVRTRAAHMRARVYVRRLIASARAVEALAAELLSELNDGRLL